MKIFKRILAVLAVLVLAVVVYLTVFFDINSFKPQIVKAVKNQTGRDLVIAQDLNLTVFPTLGVKLGGVSLSNPDGFAEKDMLSVNDAVAEIALMPLFKSEVQIARLELDGLKVNLITQKDGSNSLDGLTGDSSASTDTAADTTDTTEPSAGNGLSDLTIGGISVTNAEVKIIDKQLDSQQTFALESLTLGKFKLDDFSSLAYKFSAGLPDMTLNSEGKGNIRISSDLKQFVINGFAIENQVKGAAIPNGELNVNLTTDLDVNLNKKVAQLTLSNMNVDDIEGNGSVSVAFANKIPNIKADLELGEVDLDKFIPTSAETVSTAKNDTASSTSSVAVEPDLSAMKLVNFSMLLNIKTLKTAGLTTNNWRMDLVLKDGVLDMKQLSADLYDGRFMTVAQLDGRKKVASYKFDTELKGFQIQPFLQDAAGLKVVSGATQFNLKGSGQSLIPDNIKQYLYATGKFEVADGALYGANIPYMIRKAKATITGKELTEEEGELKTDFTSLTGSFKLENGIATNSDLAMSSPLIRLDGAGTANLLTEALDYKLTTELVGSLKGQGGETDDLAGLTVPLMITGTFQAPKFKLDTQALLDGQLKEEADKAKEKVNDKLKEKLGDELGDKIGNSLFDKLGR